eukprot:scaffold733_cov97-Cylindrotheca_fusiformis.AAC.7
MTSIASFEPNNDVKSPRSFIPNQISVRRSRRGHTLFSSFRQKSFCAPSSDAIAPLGSPSRQWSIGTTPPDPPRIRTLIQRSGIWNEIQDSNNTTNQTMHAIMEDEQGGNEPSAAAMMEGRMITRRVSIALQSTMDELLLLDGLGPLHRISNNNNSAEESQSSSSRVNGAPNRHHSRTAATTKISFQSSSEGASSRDPHSTEGTVSEVSLPSGLESDSSLRDAHASSEPCTSATQQPPPHSSPPTTTTTKNERGKEPITDSGKSPPEISRRDCLPPRALPEALDKPPPRHPSFPPGPPPPPPRPSSKFLPKTSLQTPPTLKKRFASSENSRQQFIGGMDQLNDDSQPSEHSSSSIVSDLTFASSSRRSLCTSLMVMDPRAPQLQMALEQQDLSRRRRRTTTTSATTTTRGLEQQNAATSIESSACSSTLNPPMRKRSLAPADQPPPLRKTSPITEEKMSRSSGCSSDRERILEEDEIPRSNFDREPSMDPVLPYARRNTSSSTVLLKNRRLSSVRGEEHSEIENSDDEEGEEEASIQSILIGPFSSPQHSISSPRTRLPSTSIRLDDSNPQLYPQNLDALPELKSGKNSKNTSRSSSVASKKPDPMPASLHGPFVSPSLVDTARPNLHNLLVPRKDSNPLLYPANLLSSGDDDDDDDGDGDELQRSHGNSTLSPGGMTYIPPSPLPTGKSYVPPSPLQRNGNKRTPSKWKPDEDDDSAVLLESPKVAKTNKNKKSSQQQQQKYADIVLDHGLFVSDENNHSKDIISFDPSPTTSTKKTAANKDIIFDGSSSVGSSTTSEVVVASSSPTASITKIQSRVITDHGMGETFWSRSSGGSGSNCNTGLRVKMCPAQLGYVMKGGEIRIHPGYYSGPLNTKFQMHGNGIFWFDSGDVYLGEFRNGELDGIGAMSIAATAGTTTTTSTATANMDDGSSTTKKQVFTGYFQHNEFLGEDLAEDDEIED